MEKIKENIKKEVTERVTNAFLKRQNFRKNISKLNKDGGEFVLSYGGNDARRGGLTRLVNIQGKIFVEEIIFHKGVVSQQPVVELKTFYKKIWGNTSCSPR